MIKETKKEQDRRAWVERREQFKDRSEEYERASAAASTSEEKQQLANEFGKYRTAYRQEDERLGRRTPGVALQQIMWAHWIEVAVQHELEARRAFGGVLAHPNGSSVLREFHASLVVLTASSYVVEGVYGEVKYRIPFQPWNKRRDRLSGGLAAALGLDVVTGQQLGDDLRWLFDLRDVAVHPYTESEPPRRHPAGINAGGEHSMFNAVTSERAVDIALTVIGHVGSPPAPAGRWIERWAEERQSYQASVQQLIAERDAEPLPPYPTP